MNQPMFNQLRQYVNPLEHLGEKQYSVFVPLSIAIVVYFLSEIFAYFILKNPNSMGTPDVILTFLLVIYSSFRFGLKGGITTVVASIIFFSYFLIIRHASFRQKETGTIVATALTILYALIALSLGWLRQTIDDLFSKEQQLRIQAEIAEKKFHTLADNLPALCWMARPDGYIYWFNKRWYKYTGTTTKQMQGWGWQSVHDPTVRASVLKKWQSAIKNQKAFEMTFPLKAADGTYRTFLTRIVPIKNREKKVVQWFGTNTDISEQIEIQQRKDDFIAMASHELKTPLTAMKVYSQMLLKNIQTHKQSQLLAKKVNTQVDKLTVLVSEMLDTSRVQQGKLEFNNERFILKKAALEIIHDLQAITDHQLIVKWQTKEIVYADKDRLRQVITNLITNAIKYSPEKKEIIVLSQKKGTSVIVSVQDFGIGVPKNAQKNIFERFYQVHENNASTYPGLGLGLYISKEIVTRMGGKMWVESNRGKGSTFFFSLPIYKE